MYIKSFILILFLILEVTAYSLTLNDQLQKSSVGDYIVTRNGKTFSLLAIKEITAESLMLEEIAVPSKLINLKGFSWKEWVKE